MANILGTVIIFLFTLSESFAHCGKELYVLDVPVVLLYGSLEAFLDGAMKSGLTSWARSQKGNMTPKRGAQILRPGTLRAEFNNEVWPPLRFFFSSSLLNTSPPRNRCTFLRFPSLRPRAMRGRKAFRPRSTIPSPSVVTLVPPDPCLERCEAGSRFRVSGQQLRPALHRRNTWEDEEDGRMSGKMGMRKRRWRDRRILRGLGRMARNLLSLSISPVQSIAGSCGEKPAACACAYGSPYFFFFITLKPKVE